MDIPQLDSLTTDNSHPFYAPVASVAKHVRKELQKLRDGDDPLLSRAWAIAVGLATARQIGRNNRVTLRMQ